MGIFFRHILHNIYENIISTVGDKLMTDGIIQEAFNKAKGNWLNVIVGDNDVLCIPLSVVNELQQELIEKIKQEHDRLTQIICSCDQHSGKLTAYNVFKTQLIGDNQ